MPHWVIFAILSAVFAALVAIFGKVGISGIDTTLATTIRAIIMAVFLVLLTLVFGKFEHLNTFGSKAIVFIILSGIAGALSWLFYFFALKNGPASGVAALDRLSVVFVLIFAVLFLSEKFGVKSLLGVVLFTLGAILLSLN